MAPKNDTIVAIMSLNQSVDPEFLAGFPREELDRYLERLHDVQAPNEPSATAESFPHRAVAPLP